MEFISDMMSCITPGGPWCDIVVTVHVATEDNRDDKVSLLLGGFK